MHAAPLPEGTDDRRSTRSGSPRARPTGSRPSTSLPRFNRTADELCVTELASVIWAVQMSTVEFHPWNSRRADVEIPTMADRPRSDGRLPAGASSGSPTSPARCSTSSAPSAGRRPRAARGSTSTCGSLPSRASPTSAGRRWRSRGRSSAAARAGDDHLVAQGPRPRNVFVDFNQNARDHTIASAYSVRGVPERPSRPRSPGRSSTTSSRASSRSRRWGALCRAGRPARGHRRGRVLDRSAAGVGRPRGRRSSRHRQLIV